MLSEAIPAALGASLYPPGLLFVAYLLANPQPRKRALTFLSGAIITAVGVGFAVVLLLRDSGAQSRTHRTVSPWIDVALGALLVLFAAVVFFWRPPRGPKAASKHHKELGVLGLFLVGCFMYSPSPFYLASLHAVAKGDESGVGTALSVLLIAVIYMWVVEVPIALHAIWPASTIRWMTATNTWVAKHGRTIIIIAAAGFGSYLLASGIDHLTHQPQ